MAIKATIYKAQLQVADMDRNHYGDYALTIARHPSETDERMMMRLLAFALNASEALAFGRGISDDDEPDLWQKDLTGQIESWIEVGQPDERRLLKAAGRSGRVLVYAYSPTTAVWWKQMSGKLERTRNVSVVQVSSESSNALAALAQRTMQLNCTVQDGQVWIGDATATVQVEPQVLKADDRQR